MATPPGARVPADPLSFVAELGGSLLDAARKHGRLKLSCDFGRGVYALEAGEDLFISEDLVEVLRQSLVEQQRRTCIKCGRDVAYPDGFPKHAQYSDGRRPWCRVCDCERYRKMRARRPRKTPIRDPHAARFNERKAG